MFYFLGFSKSGRAFGTKSHTDHGFYSLMVSVPGAASGEIVKVAKVDAKTYRAAMKANRSIPAS